MSLYKSQISKHVYQVRQKKQYPSYKVSLFVKTNQLPDTELYKA